MVVFGVLGPVTAWDDSGRAVALKGPRHRAVLARLIIAKGRVVPVTTLVDDLWDDPPPGAIAAVRTFVAALRRALEPHRPPRTPPHLLITEGPGYALRTDDVDARHFEQAVSASATAPAEQATALLEKALTWWRGPAYADFTDQDWTIAERARLAELRLHAVERHAEARLASGLAAEVVPDLDAHVTGHPWRENAWRLLALALYRAGRQADALSVLRRARDLLSDRLGLDPGPALRRLESDILHQSPALDAGQDPDGSRAQAVSARGPDPEAVWARATAAYDRAAPSAARTRLESTVALMRDLAITGGTGLLEARHHRAAAVEAAEELGDPLLTARVIGLYDVPANWTRSDDPAQAGRLVAAAERTLTALPPEATDAIRARLLATIALESRATSPARAREAAREAERIARDLDDPALLAFALNGAFMQSFHRTGLARQRDAIGEELITLSARHGLVTYEVLGHLIRLQSRCALGDFTGADEHARAADHLAGRHEIPLVRVFTAWYRALRLDVAGLDPGRVEAGRQHAATSEPERVEAAYREAAGLLDGAGMPGLEHGLLPLALLCARVRRGLPLLGDETAWGPYEPWVRPLVLLGLDRREEAAEALRHAPDPPPDLLQEALWCLMARAAVALGDHEAMRRAGHALAPAAGELAAGSGLLTAGDVDAHLAALDRT